MRLAELSERSGLPTATIKYYLREQLLPPGVLVSAKQADYGEEHLRRLRLVRALIQIGRMPIATAREVLTAIDDENLDQNDRLGVAVGALPPGLTRPDQDDRATAAARREADLLLDSLGWEDCAEASSGPYRALVAALAALAALGYPHDLDHLLPYAQQATRLAAHDLDMIQECEGPSEQIEAAVALTVLYEPVLLSLRRLAHARESALRHGTRATGRSTA
ncbi:MerR family transcriptional regulator [Kitasatospora sp. NPDC057692]|uniref:MerR family transcriptional regulator n=1 Tax=Kitasatospora sp. NPDC057692 TaxID=3346215 RepID=UPI003678BB87